MKYERGSFITVGSRDTLRGLHPTAQTLYMWLSSYANETGNCFPSRKTLATDCGCSEDTIDKMLLVLLEKGLIQKQNRVQGGEKLSNLYTVLVIGGSRQNRLPSPPESATLAARNGINSNHLTQPTEEGALEDELRFVTVTESDEERAPRKKPKYPNARTVSRWFRNPDPAWLISTTEQKCLELIYEWGEEKAKKRIAYAERNIKEDGFPIPYVTPYMIANNVKQLAAYAERNS